MLDDARISQAAKAMQQRAADLLRADGHDGLNVQGSLPCVIVFFLYLVKSIYNRGTFDARTPYLLG